MTELRKKIQDKLRRKYKYSTNTDHGRGMILIKPLNEAAEGTDYLNFIYLYHNVTPEFGEIMLFYGDKYICGLAFEEFELVYKALKEYHDYEKYGTKLSDFLKNPPK